MLAIAYTVGCLPFFVQTLAAR